MHASWFLFWHVSLVTGTYYSSADYLRATLSDEEKVMLIDWALRQENGPLSAMETPALVGRPVKLRGLPGNEDWIAMLVLQELVLNPAQTPEHILGVLDNWANGQNETVATIAVRKSEALKLMSVPAWMHETILRWPEMIFPPPAALTDHLSALAHSAPSGTPPHLLTPKGMLEATAVWSRLCIEPLRRWNRLDTLPCAADNTGRFVLSNGIVKKILNVQLARLRASLGL